MTLAVDLDPGPALPATCGTAGIQSCRAGADPMRKLLLHGFLPLLLAGACAGGAPTPGGSEVQGRIGTSASTATEAKLKEAVAVREKVLGPEDPDVAQSLANLANLYRDQGRLAEAEPLYRRALAVRE